MLGLKLPTDPRWINVAEKNLEEILIDHAYCEQKAASHAISLMVNFPEYPELVETMVKLAQEELSHFEMVLQKIKERNFNFGPERKDEYVNELYNFIRKGGRREHLLTDRLLFAAMIEARSCERFKILSEKIKDEDLKNFYHALMISEAKHYTTFINLAKKLCGHIENIDERWKQWLDYESSIIQKYGKKELIHG
ncbi:MAG: tRNA 2-methylthio-N6-isopentenyl adenosine(37) hydroxylase MiaE [Bacteroidia bacterium]|nr:MAG: tRNA 2-methylthio-N6-isopentenyl adenosine(37) hydroxylase MiaE [Bacteroidia bacterium]